MGLSKVAAAVIGVSLVAAALFAFAAPQVHAALTEAQIQSILSLLTSFGADQTTITNVNASLRGQATGGVSSSACPYTWTKNLQAGSTGADVLKLQQFLNASADTQVASSGAGSPGNETSTFGPATKAAVVKFQNKHAADVLTPVGLTAGTGFFGASSRAKANSLCTGTTPTTPTTPTPTTPGAAGSVTVAAAVQPAATLAPQGSARVPFTKVNLTAGATDVTVNSLTIERVGLAQDAVFAGIVLLDENGTQIGIAKTLNSNHQAVVGEAFVVKAGTTRTITVAGNMAASLSSYAGQVAGLNVVAVNTSASVSGSLPVAGAGHTVNATLAIGTVTTQRGSTDPGASQTKEVGTTAYTFSAIKITAGSAEDIYLKSIRWNQTGSAGASDLANLKTIVNGVNYDVVVESNGQYYTTVFPGAGLLIQKGFSIDASIKGDIAGGSARTIAFDIAKRTDINIVGALYGYGITPPLASSAAAANGSAFNNADDQYYEASLVTISSGTLTVSVWNGVPAQNIAINLANQPLAGYTVEIKGEPISVASIKFNLGTTVSITNVTMVDQNGAVLAGPVDTAGTNVAALTFTDTITFPVGITNVTLKGKLSTSYSNNDSVRASTTPSTQWTTVTGQVTGKTITPSPTSAITASNMTVKGGSLTVSVSTQPPAQTVVAGAQQFTFANYILDSTQSGEDVRLTTLPLYFSFSTGAATDLTNCQLYDGSVSKTTGSNTKDPTAASSSTTFTFDGDGLTVSKGTSKTLALKCNVSTSATGGYWWGIDAGQNSTFTGVTGKDSGQTIAETFIDANGQVMTAATAGSYTVASDASVLYKVAQAGSSDVTLGVFKFSATASEDINVKQVALQLGSTASNSPADLAGLQMTLWDGATQLGIAQFGSGSQPDFATSTLTSNFVIPRGETKNITVKGSLAVQNAVEGTPGAFVAVTYDGNNNGSATSATGNYALGVSSNTTVGGGTTSDQTTNGIRIFRTIPTVADVTTATGLAAGSDLYAIQITAGSGRDVGMKHLRFTVSTTGANVKGFQLFGPAGAVNSTSVNASAAANPFAVDIDWDNNNADRLIAAGTSKTFRLRATTVTGLTAANTESINIALLADTGYPSLSTAMGTVPGIQAGASTTDRFVWSPFSTTSPTTANSAEDNLDWTNGYGVPGYPSVGQDFSVRVFKD